MGFAGGGYQSRKGSVCAAGSKPGVSASSVIAAIWWGWRSGIAPAGQTGWRSATAGSKGFIVLMAAGF